MSKYQNWINIGLEKGLSDIEIKIVESRNLNLAVYDETLENNEVSSIRKCVIKGIYNGKASHVSVEDLSDDNVELMIDRLVDSAKNITASEPALIYEGSDSYVEVNEVNFDFVSINPNDKVNLLLEIEKGIKKEKLLSKVSNVQYSETESNITIVNSKGLNLSRNSAYALIYAVGVYQEDEQVKSGLSYQIVKDFNHFDANKLISDNIKRGLGQLGAKPIASKKYPVVFEQEQMGEMLSVFWSIFTGEAAFRNLTKLKGLENSKIANDIVNLVDDPFHSEALFKNGFDDEGVATKKHYLIKDGVFTGFVHNLKTAAIFNTEPTGHGFSNSIGPSNLVLEPQDISLREVLETIEEGVYIDGLVGLHAGVEQVSGNFSLQASGFKIENGKLTKPVDMIVVSGNFFELLNEIEYIANDFIFGMSGVGTGSVKVKQLTIAGE